MTSKSLLIIGTLALASLASAKSYDIILSSPTMAGGTELKAGEYKVSLEGTQAVITDVQTAKSVTLPVKVEKAAKKFDLTTVETTKSGDMDNILAIDLGGSTTKIAFGQ